VTPGNIPNPDTQDLLMGFFDSGYFDYIINSVLFHHFLQICKVIPNFDILFSFGEKISEGLQILDITTQIGF